MKMSLSQGMLRLLSLPGPVLLLQHHTESRHPWPLSWPALVIAKAVQLKLRGLVLCVADGTECQVPFCRLQILLRKLSCAGCIVICIFGIYERIVGRAHGSLYLVCVVVYLVLIFPTRLTQLLLDLVFCSMRRSELRV